MGMPCHTGLIVRAMQREDIPELADLWKRSVTATHTFLTPDMRSKLYTEVRTIYLPSVEQVWIAASPSGKAAGFLGANGNHVEMLFVDANYLGQRIGKTLLAVIEHKEGLPLFVDVNEQNPAALGFYLHEGFQQIGRSPRDSEGRPFPLLHLKKTAANAD